MNTQLFPIIKHIDDLVPFLNGNPQFRVAEQPNGTTVVCYMLQDEDTFSGDNEEFAKECRGITFDTATGRILSRTLHKFQNVGENASTQPDMIPWGDIVRIMDKRDGSMITFVEVDGQIVAKTKKTFTSNEALAATEFLYKDQDRVEWVRAILKAGFTPTFEWTSPRFPIVLTYEKDELTLLQIRENISGRYLSEGEIRFWLPTFKADLFPLVENLISKFSSPQELLELAKTTEGVEGWIIQADNGEMWKVKTAWYVQLHHSVTFTRWRDVARTVCEDKSDDLKSAFTLTGRTIEPILQVEQKVFGMINETRENLTELAQINAANGLTAKEMAAKFNSHECFGLIMRLFRGQEIDWMEWYVKNHLQAWPLDVIPTSAQNEDLAVENG